MRVLAVDENPNDCVILPSLVSGAVFQDKLEGLSSLLAFWYF